MSGRLPSVTSPDPGHRKPCPAPRESVPAPDGQPAVVVWASPGVASGPQHGGTHGAGRLATNQLRVNIRVTVRRCLSPSPVRRPRTEPASHRRSRSQCFQQQQRDQHHSSGQRGGGPAVNQPFSHCAPPDKVRQAGAASSTVVRPEPTPCPSLSPQHSPQPSLRLGAPPSAQHKAQVSPQPRPRPSLRPSPQPSPQPSPRPSPRSIPQRGPQPNSRSSSRSSPRPSPQPSPRPSPQPSPRPSPQPSPRQQTRTQASTADQRERLLAACRRFNAAPTSAIEAMIAKGLLSNSPWDVARFLYGREDLCKKAIGQYLGTRGEFPCDVLAAFVQAFDFRGLPLLAALRTFVSAFLLHGEQQQVCRIVECFADQYRRQNPASGLSMSACRTLSDALVLLNTLLHNPNVHEKPNLEVFIDMVGSVGRAAVSADELAWLYRQLSIEPLKVPTDDCEEELRRALRHPERSGLLRKQGGRHKTWKERWFILKHNSLHYFEHSDDKQMKGVIVLENVLLRTVPELIEQNCFELAPTAAEPAYLKSCKWSRDRVYSEGHHTVFRMSASSQQEMAEWMRAIQRSIVLRPLQLVRNSLKAAAGDDAVVSPQLPTAVPH